MKPKHPDDLRMSAAEFDKAMRGALSAEPPKRQKAAPKRAKNTKPKNKENSP